MKNYINMLISWVIINLNSKDKALIDFDYFKAMFFPFSYLKISIYRFLLFLFYLSLYYSVDLGLLTKAFSHNSNDSYIFFNIIFTIIHFLLLPYMWFFASFKNKISHKINIEYAYISLIFIVALLYLFYNIFPSFSLLVISLIIHIVCYFFRVKTIYLFFLTIAIFITYYQQFYKIFSKEVILNINLFYMYLALAINYIYNTIISKLK